MSHQFEVQLLHATIPIEALRVWRASSSATLKQLQNIDPPEFSYSLHVFLGFFLFVKIYALSAFGQVHDPYVWSQVRHVGVIWFVLVFSNFSRLDFHDENEICVV